VKIESFRRFWGNDTERYKVHLSFMCSQDELENLNLKQVKEKLAQEGVTQ
jgi:hypothetical protein